MATATEIQSQKDALIATNTALGVKINSATFFAQSYYNSWKSAESQADLPRSELWTGSVDGQVFTDYAAYTAALQSKFQESAANRKTLATEFNANVAKMDELTVQAAAAEDPTATVKSPEATNESQSDKTAAAAQAETSETPAAENTEQAATTSNAFDDKNLPEEPIIENARIRSLKSTDGTAISKGAETSGAAAASANWAGTKDLRTILRVPATYLSGLTAGPANLLTNFGGILFPYTPSITYDNQATYTAMSPTHSNYTQYFYKSSNVGPITITGKLTSQNQADAEVWLAIQHLLRSLTKMRFGSDENAGAPPPVCRLDAYGDMMLSNVPVSVVSWKMDLPDSVDYIAVKEGQYAQSLVPSISSLSITLNLMYSRKEIREFSVDKWIAGSLKNKGYL